VDGLQRLTKVRGWFCRSGPVLGYGIF
jgi:hypothetical protein